MSALVSALVLALVPILVSTLNKVLQGHHRQTVESSGGDVESHPYVSWPL